ncbi:isocitrate lyase/PEP mutase family protein [Azospirillum sp. RWY-5-1]|uniref:Isocitrate lyase/PEP mutase family protein n=1 Tax=Azospirillum oleiclasticum TaxID=2735135 RepID=A0ABX2TEE0_9PROT|nr:isocitrate lyase/PEP mutase family protein [Azospirillum oleiclasticum]NYZ14049.1 isocitrate lyase/PEP mutase family protein [Azospirillum oleiclasticum]NYZ21533.1 isocitrate lyase/PEP mutase family protein [Azospirillum oleiclasticum]
MKRTTRFKQLVLAPEILLLPGVQDALTARIAADAGFSAITCGGYATTATLLGAPDTSQLGMTEMADHYARICDAVDVPVFADADTGFGNVTNVRRTVRAYERAGVAGFFIEDQVYPKRCGHMPGKAVVPVEEMVAKLKAALDARQDPDLMIMARTDALAVNGLDDAIERGRLYREIGADMVFVEAPTSVEQMRRICAEIDAPCMANNVEGGSTPILPAAELQAIGYAVSVFPCATTYTITHAVGRLMRTLMETGSTDAARDGMLDFDAFNRFIGLPEQRKREADLQDFARSKAGGR